MKKQTKTSTYPYPSVYGSHKSMITKGPDQDGFIVCRDEYGDYVTTIDRLDTGLCDPNRCGERMIEKKEKRDNK